MGTVLEDEKVNPAHLIRDYLSGKVDVDHLHGCLQSIVEHETSAGRLAAHARSLIAEWMDSDADEAQLQAELASLTGKRPVITGRNSLSTRASHGALTPSDVTPQLSGQRLTYVAEKPRTSPLRV
jgi:hypothetical protein